LEEGAWRLRLSKKMARVTPKLKRWGKEPSCRNWCCLLCASP
jgi:hypothetical protein